ncbi:MAG TPA: hypothetical protein DDY49_06555 [Paenibacillaceae bacterium]|nr:hypothetical protein [Paenibacillaceae bacterium]
MKIYPENARVSEDQQLLASIQNIFNLGIGRIDKKTNAIYFVRLETYKFSQGILYTKNKTLPSSNVILEQIEENWFYQE